MLFAFFLDFYIYGKTRWCIFRSGVKINQSFQHNRSTKAAHYFRIGCEQLFWATRFFFGICRSVFRPNVVKQQTGKKITPPNIHFVYAAVVSWAHS
jgi:hypothetical protein